MARKTKTTAIVKQTEPMKVIKKFTLKDAMREWLLDRRSPHTRAAYYHDLVDFCQTVFNAEPEKALRRFFSLKENIAGAIVTQFRQLLRERGLSPASINRKLSALRAFINHARKRGIVNWHVSDLIEGEKNETKREEVIRRLLPATTVDGLVKALQKLFSVLPKEGVNGLRNRAIVALMALHGLRRVEVCRLSLSDLFEEEEGCFTIQILGKRNKIRIIKLRDDTTELIKRYLSAIKRASIEPIADELGIPLFVSLRKEKGKRLTPQQVNNIVDEAWKAAGIKRQGLSCHSLRHSFGSLAATKEGVTLPDLAAYMGHANISTTSLYVHAISGVNPSEAIKELRAI